MSEDFAAVKRKVNRALRDFVRNEYSLLERDLYEVTVSSKLASYLQRLFPNHKVDAEYNKHGASDKLLKDRVVRPDIVVHRRGHDDMNLVVVEMKKKDRPTTDDIEKLIDFTDPHGTDGYCYDFGLFLAFNHDHAGLFQPRTRWFIAGTEVTEGS